MSNNLPQAALNEAAAQIEEAAAAKKCWPCGCLHNSLVGLERLGHLSPKLQAALTEAKGKLEPVRYDCLGCQVCFPALAVNAINQAGHGSLGEVETCPTEKVAERQGWPPLPGSYTVLRYRAPVALCTLTDENLAAEIAAETNPHLAIVGTLQTENLGIERVIFNVLANPNIRFLIVCGADSKQAIGHLPGQSLVALARSGLNDRGCINGAAGKRPVLRNLEPMAVEHFRATVEVVDLVGIERRSGVLEAIEDCAGRDPGPAEPFAADRVLHALAGYRPQRMKLDPAGYFVVYVDRSRRILYLEHYRNEGLLDLVIEGPTAAELWTPAIERGLVSRLDHAAYLGRELALAERALASGEPYVQDAAPERGKTEAPSPTCGCDASCVVEDER